MNLCFEALDLNVVRGRAAEPALVNEDGKTVDFANLLELAAALGGAMRGVGVVPGDRIAVALEGSADELVAVLAAARVGAVPVLTDADGLVAAVVEHRPRLVATSTLPDFGDDAPEVCVLRGPAPIDPHRDLDWELAMKAGRGDPAASAALPEGVPAYVVDGRNVFVSDVPQDTSILGRALATLVSGKPVDLSGDNA